MDNDPRESIMPGSRVRVFDRGFFVNDEVTPLSVTMKPATVVCRYGKTWAQHGKVKFNYPDLVDVEFDHRPGEVSRGHFTNMVEEEPS